jgi:hypothetical protein
MRISFQKQGPFIFLDLILALEGFHTFHITSTMKRAHNTTEDAVLNKKTKRDDLDELFDSMVKLRTKCSK